jgi:hypothetical protein
MSTLGRMVGKNTNAKSEAGQSRLIDDDLEDYITNAFMLSRVENGLGCHGESFRAQKKIDIIPVSLVEETVAKFQKDITTIFIDSRATLIQSEQLLVKVKHSSNIVYVDIIGDKAVAKDVTNKLKDSMNAIDITVDWITNKDMNTVSIPLSKPRGISNSSYPFITQGVDKFVNDYLTSTENVLILIGPPGTGKSNFIQYVIAQSKRNAMVTFDPEIMKADDIFANFIESDAGSFIMEDADAFLSARVEGNLSMHRFLNVSSGIVSMSNKKLIFSTNLNSSDDIDKALMRPGRCYDVVNFRPLTNAEAIAFLKEHDLGVDLELITKSTYTLAELYNMSSRARTHTKKTIGFV